ncbi:MAG: hypothetical protein IAE67_03565 [Candidatus Competibacteraceae bacterium]|nr:hypothetical protein [Candidatus Competibacteraceae bacterium]
MIGLFGKKKIKTEELIPVYVQTIYDVINKGFGEIAGYINEEKEFEKSPNLSDKEHEWFLFIVYAGNLINLDNYFNKVESAQLRRLISKEIISFLGKDSDTTDQMLYDYEAFLKSLFDQNKNLNKAISMAIFHKYDLNKFQKEHFQKLNTPSPIVMKELNEMVDFFLWNWSDYLSKYKLVFTNNF